MNDKASSSTLVEVLASHETKDMKISIEIIKKRKLTIKLEFNDPKTKKNTKMTKNDAPSASLPIYKRKMVIFIS